MKVNKNIVKLGLLSTVVCTAAGLNVSNTNNFQKLKTHEILVSDTFEKKTDKEKIIEFNRAYNEVYKNKCDQNYAIVDKKKCTLTVYNPDGEAIKKFTVGLGSKKGDKLGYGSNLEKSNPKYREGEYTTPGEFVLDQVPTHRRTSKSIKLYGDRIIYLKGDNKGEDSTQEAIHQCSGEYGRKRLANDKQGKISDNRFSSGCVIMLPEQYDELLTYLGEGDKVYILPEEKGNKLILEEKDGALRFVQKYHKDQKRDLNEKEASQVIYDYNPEKATTIKDKVIGRFYSLFK